MSPTPLILLDVDGVLLPFGGEPPAGCVRLASPDENWCLPEAMEIFALAELVELAWCSGWEPHIASELVPLFELAGWPLPQMRELAMPIFTDHERTWKLPLVQEEAGDRPLVWVDDEIGADAWAWAEAREHPTLLVQPRPHLGLSRAQLEEIRAWLEALPG